MENIAGFPIDEVVHQVELNLWETWSNFGRGPGCSLHDEGDVLWFETPIPVLPYNTVLKFQVENNIDKRVDALVNRFKERNVPQLWIVHPSYRPKDLPERLEKRGLQEIEIAPCMGRGLENLPDMLPLPDGVEIREAVGEQDLMELYGLAAWRWGVPEEFRPQLSQMSRNSRSANALPTRAFGWHGRTVSRFPRSVCIKAPARQASTALPPNQKRAAWVSPVF